MNKVISVITAVHAPGVKYLHEAYESLSNQELPDGWRWEWIVQEDGELDVVKNALPRDPRISYGCGRIGGPGVARTVALARVTGELVRNLDADDRLLPGALARDIEILERYPGIGWTTTKVLDLLPDGSIKEWPYGDPEEGVIPLNWVLTFWRDNNWLLPVHPTTLCIRRNLLVALGGWMALISGEDTGLVIAANVISQGYFIREPSILYRKHPDQVTAQPYHVEPVDLDARRRLITARAEALGAVLRASQPGDRSCRSVDC